MKNNRGLSLIELIIAFALLALVGVGAMGLMATGTNLFASSTREIDLQTEAQNVINHMNNFIIDTERGISFVDGTDESVLQVFNETVVHVLTWKKADKEIYYQDKTITYSGGTPSEGSPSSAELLASNVENFAVDLTHVDDKRNVTVSIKLAYGDRIYEASQDFSLRNDIKANQPLTEYYDDEVVGLINQVDEVKISEEKVFVSKGAKHAFTARVSGIGYPSQRVTWSMTGGNGSTTLSDFGLLEIGNDQTNPIITVRATSVADSSKYDEAEVVIVSVNDITVLADANPIRIGKVVRLHATVVMDGDPVAAGVPGDLLERVTFRLPADSPDGLELYQTSSMTNYCELICGTDMENDPEVREAFTNQGYIPVTIEVASRFNDEQWFPRTINIYPSDLTGVGIEGSLIADRNSTLELDATLDAEGITSRDIRTTWEITKDAGLGDKVKIDKNTGILTVDKNIDYSKEFVIEVTVTASVSNSTKKIEHAVNVTIPKVTISVPASTSVEKGTSKRLAFKVNGLKAEKGDVICTSKPGLKNTLMYCTENECVISVGERESRDLVSVRLMLKENTSIVQSFTLYVLSETEMYNVEGRKNVFAPYYTPTEVGTGKEEKSENGTTLKYTVVGGTTKLTIKKTSYFYNEKKVDKGVTGWWMAESNVEGEEFYVPVPGLSPDLPDSISVSYKLNYDEKLLTYTEENGTTYVKVEIVVKDDAGEILEVIEKNFYLDGEAWKIKR